jgi:hypothetical protein
MRRHVGREATLERHRRGGDGGSDERHRTLLKLVLPLIRIESPGVYRRGSCYVVVYRSGGRQCKQSAVTRLEARTLKLERDADAREQRRGPALHAYALDWLGRYAGSGHDSVRENTRREYRRLLVNFALNYFDREMRVRDLDRARVQRERRFLTRAELAALLDEAPPK